MSFYHPLKHEAKYELTFHLCHQINRTVHLLKAFWHYSFRWDLQKCKCLCMQFFFGLFDCSLYVVFLMLINRKEFYAFCTWKIIFNKYCNIVIFVKLTGHNKEHRFPVTWFSVYSVSSQKLVLCQQQNTSLQRRRCNGPGLVKIQSKDKHFVHEDKTVLKHAWNIYKSKHNRNNNSLKQ